MGNWRLSFHMQSSVQDGLTDPFLVRFVARTGKPELSWHTHARESGGPEPAPDLIGGSDGAWIPAGACPRL